MCVLAIISCYECANLFLTALDGATMGLVIPCFL